MKRVDYVGMSNIRSITAANLASVGLTGPDLVWDKSNNYELDVEDNIALYLSSSPEFVVEGGPAFGNVLGENVVNVAELGFWRTMNPITSTVKAIDNSSAKTTLLQAPHSMPNITVGAMAHVVAFGSINNQSGGATDLTITLERAAALITEAKVNLANDTSSTRHWKFEAWVYGGIFLAEGIFTTSHLSVAAGATDPAKVGLPNVGGVYGTAADPSNWDLFGKFSVANASTELTIFGASVEYVLPGGVSV